MKDVYLRNKATGTLTPAETVFKEFYKTHGIFDDVFDYYDETNITVENTFIEFPDFANTLN